MYRKHMSVIAITSEFTIRMHYFNKITIGDALKEIFMLDSSKAIQATDIPVKAIKCNIIFLQKKYAFVLMRLFLLVKENFQIV